MLQRLNRRRFMAFLGGFGITGMTAALGLANQGFEVHLVEKERDLVAYIPTSSKTGFNVNESIMYMVDNLIARFSR